MLLTDKSKSTFSAVLTIGMASHENTSAARFSGALTPQSGDLAVLVDLVELEDGQLDLLLLMLVLLGCGVLLLLALLGTTSKSEIQHNAKKVYMFISALREGTGVD